MAEIADIIRAAAAQYGLDPNTMLRIGQVESGLNPNSANPSSSARGVYQFIAPTWAKYGRGADPLDPTANIDAGMRFTRDNQSYLRGALGRDPTPGELYLAHQQGAGGAVNMLRNPNAPAGNSQAIALNGGQPGMTNADFAAKWTGKFDGAQPAAGGSTAPLQAATGGYGPLERQDAMSPILAAFANTLAPPAAKKKPKQLIDVA